RAAGAAHFDTAVLPLLVRRGGDEGVAALGAVDARIARQLPRAGTERAAQRATAAGHFRQRRPRAARRAVTAVPGLERRRQRAAGRRGQQRLLQPVGERADGELRDEPQQVGREPVLNGPAANCALVAREARGQKRRRGDLAGGQGGLDVGGGVAGAAFGQRGTELQR